MGDARLAEIVDVGTADVGPGFAPNAGGRTPEHARPFGHLRFAVVESDYSTANKVLKFGPKINACLTKYLYSNRIVPPSFLVIAFDSIGTMSTDDNVISTIHSGEQISEHIIDAVANITNTDPTALPPLYDTLDVDALNQLCQSSDGTVAVTFEYGACEVVIEGPDAVIVAPLDE